MYTSIRCTCLKIFKKCYIRYSTALQLGTGHWATDQNPYIYLYRTAIPGTAYRKLKVLLSMIYSQPIIQYIFFGLANRCPEQSRVYVYTHTARCTKFSRSTCTMVLHVGMLYCTYHRQKNTDIETLSFRWILPFWYFCFLLGNVEGLALFPKRKQKYQNGNIHRKLRVPTSEREGKLSNPRGHAARARCMNFFLENLRNPAQ